MRRGRNNREAKTIRTFTRINHQIRVSQVRLIGPNGEQIGIVSTSEALTRAHESAMDLIEISPNAQPPVCRITDYGKFRYELEKKEKQARKHQANTKVKEVKFHANVDEHDFQTKIRHIKEFVAEGHRVKASLMFRGRENAHEDIGYQVMNRVIKEVSDVAGSERNPEKMGRTLYMMLTPRPAVKAKAHAAPAKPAS